MGNHHTTGSSIVDRNPDRIISLREAAHLSSLSEDTLKRRYPNIVRKLSPRRCGVRLGDVLSIGLTTEDAP